MRLGCGWTRVVEEIDEFTFRCVGQPMRVDPQRDCDVLVPKLSADVVADAFRNELAWLGITHSPSFVGEPQGNGVIERFMRTLKEQCLWIHRFRTLDEARTVIAAFIERYDHQWLIERLGHRTPATAPQEMLAMAA